MPPRPRSREPATAHPLDRPVWAALRGRQARFSQGDALAVRFAPRFGPLAAARDGSEAALEALARLDFGAEGLLRLEPDPPPPSSAVVERVRGEGVQMVLRRLRPGGPDVRARVLGSDDAPDMRRFAEATRPGPFASHTFELSEFLGVFDDGRLVAMAGERLALPGFSEISGICTDPAYRGKGLAGALTRLVADRILRRGETPFLHAHADNAAAVALYEKLGFEVRLRLHAIVLGAARAPSSGRQDVADLGAL